MRVVEPNKQKTVEKKTRSRKPLRVTLFLLLLGSIAAAYYAFDTASEPVSVTTTEIPETTVTQNTEVTEPDPRIENKGEFIQFSGNEFRLFYDNLLQPNLVKVENPPEITGNDIADTRIREIAEARGYKLRSSPATDLSSVDGYPLQEAAQQPWLDLKAAAAAEGLSMSLVSGYRSVDTQRGLYTNWLFGRGVTVEEVANGLADEAVDAVLVTSSIPGYSKHHTGYTIDLACAGYAFENFGASDCFEWLSADNYANAKEFGFIPSYPDDADNQGPDPEAWEYVYVGRDLLVY